jgi:hypothetical protein
VFEDRRPPLVSVVTRFAFFLSVTKLVGMWIRMTISAVLRGSQEIYMAHC